MKTALFRLLVIRSIPGDSSGATPVLKIAAGACPNMQNLCTDTNGLVTTTLLMPKLITDSSTLLNDFSAAFKSWNTDGTWTLKEAELSDDAVLTLTTYRAFINEGNNCGIRCGGAEIDITYTPGATDPPALTDRNRVAAGDAVWSQAIDTSEKREPALPGNPYLDNAPDTVRRRLPAPAYPYTHVGSGFYDKPSRDSTAIWIGDAYLTTINYRTKTLTLFDGVEWGFTVTDVPPGDFAAVPEPASLLLFAAGGICMVLYRKRRYLLAIRGRKSRLPC